LRVALAGTVEGRWAWSQAVDRDGNAIAPARRLRDKHVSNRVQRPQSDRLSEQL
jgi:hypothetical protein